MQLQLHFRIAEREIAQHRRQHVAGLQMRGRNRQRAFVLAVEFGADAFEVSDFAQRSAGGRNDRLAGRRQ
jgi:hypothetical protein